MDARPRTVQALLHTGDQYVIPLFQRYYTWEKEDWERLWSDLLLLMEEGSEQKRHFLGPLVTVPDRHAPGATPAYMVIDGQQRLTTLSLLFCALRDEARENGWNTLASEIEKSYLVNEFRTGDERYKLSLRLRDRAMYLSLIDEPETAIGVTRLLSAYHYHRKRIGGEEFNESEAFLRAFFMTAAQRLEFVAITLAEENPYKIFQSLNSTGVPLAEADLIRNYVFMKVPGKEQERFDEVAWTPLEHHFDQAGVLDAGALTGFLRDALISHGSYVGRDATFEAFEERYPFETLQPFDVLKELNELAKLRDIIAGLSAHASEPVHLQLAALRELDVGTSYPLMLELLRRHQNGELPIDQLIDCIGMTSGFVFRRYVCGESSRGYGRWFAAACAEIETDPRRKLRAFYVAKGWPHDERFRAAFERMNLYHSGYALAVLARLERSLQRSSEVVSLDQCQIEHVMPQTIGDDEEGKDWKNSLGEGWEQTWATWLHTPGNLTLVGGDYNASMSNQAFEAKKPILSESRVYLNVHFRNPSLQTWTAKEIAERARTLSSMARTLWPGSEVAQTTI